MELIGQEASLISESAACRHINVANLIEEGRWGGPQKRITQVAFYLQAHGVKTVVLLPRRESDRFRKELEEVEIDYKLLPLHRLGRGWKILSVYALTFLTDIYAIWRTLRTEHYDLLHVSGGVWQFKGPIAGWLAGVPVIWHLNDSQMPNSLVRLFRLLGGLADVFFVSANRVGHFYLKDTRFDRMPCYLVPPPVITDVCDPNVVEIDEQIAGYPFPRIVTVCNINPVKGLEILIDAASKLKGCINQFSVIIVGPVPDSQNRYRAQLDHLIREYRLEGFVHFVGAHLHVERALKAADIYVCSSHSESGPMSLWEAMSMGCAVVSTNVGDVVEYVDNGYNGFVVPVADAESMADRIQKLVQNEVLRKLFGERARMVARRQLDVHVIAEKTAAAYREISEKHCG